MKIARFALLFLTSTAITSCGGGDSQMPKDTLEGIWRGELTFLEGKPASCSTNQKVISTNHKVSVSGKEIALEDNGRRHKGTLINDSEFEVKFIQVSAFASTVLTIGYRNVFNNRAEVTLKLNESAFSKESGSVSGCSYTWTGTMVR